MSQSELNSEKRFQKVYDAVFDSEQVYKLGACNTNIYNFLKVLEACDVDLPSSAKVIYIADDDLDLVLEKTRNGVKSWYFHVVLELQGQIFDFDYVDRNKTPNIKEYFPQQLTGHRLENYKKLTLRIIPGEEYRRLYTPDLMTGEYTFYYFLLPERSTYPEFSIPAYLSKN